eukprot:scaffold8727_cov62-Cyclotella_meneghiniana.AAC.2
MSFRHPSPYDRLKKNHLAPIFSEAFCCNESTPPCLNCSSCSETASKKFHSSFGKILPMNGLTGNDTGNYSLGQSKR